MSSDVFIQSKIKKEHLPVHPQKMLITVEDYHHMGAAGIFVNKPRVELLNGEIYTMSPFSPNHNSHVDKITEFFIFHLYGKAKVRPQGSVQLDDFSEPEPDITILKYKADFYNKQQATNKDVHLLIEVAVFTLERDRTIKKQKYAAAGIPEYWIVAPEKEIVEVYRKPSENDYAEKLTYGKSDTWKFAAFDLAVKGVDILI